ncbi:MAG: hypothetical protein HC900_03400 [Methylacidiphilales bacterium]|nr:hypothetical protein [Candidatus Methylacidiphilales bacterium]
MATKTTARPVRKYEDERQSAVENYDVLVTFAMRADKFEQLEAVVQHQNMSGSGAFVSDIIRHAINLHVNEYKRSNGLVL